MWFLRVGSLTGKVSDCDSEGFEFKSRPTLQGKKMNREKAIKMVIETKAISAFTRNFVEWLYKNGYIICTAGELSELEEFKWMYEDLCK